MENLEFVFEDKCLTHVMGGSSYQSASSETEIYFWTVRISPCRESPKNTETLCDMGGTFSYSLSPHISQASLQYILNPVTEATDFYHQSAMTWAIYLSAMFSSVIKAKNLQLYKKLQNLLSLFQKLKSRLISALQTHMSLRPLKCYLLSIFWVLPLWNPLRKKEAILMCAKKMCARKVWCQKKPQSSRFVYHRFGEK